jgi:hypothetical protein
MKLKNNFNLEKNKNKKKTIKIIKIIFDIKIKC